MGKVAFVVCGPESSGTRVVTKALIAAGAHGDGGHRQNIDPENLVGLPDKIVYRYSLPHAKHWPDVKLLLQQVELAGYKSILVITNRDPEFMAFSQLRAPHTISLDEARLNIMLAYKYLKELEGAADDSITIQYEDLVEGDHLQLVLSWIGMELPDTFKVFDGNAKYKLSSRARNILLCTHAPWRNTGYGSTTDALVKGLITLGHNVTLFAISNAGAPGTVELPEYDVILPPANTPINILPAIVRDRNIDTVITNFDVWAIKDPRLFAELGAQWFPWFPVEQDPLAFNMKEALSLAKVAVTYSTWGVQALKRHLPKLPVRKIHMPVMPAFFDIALSKEEAKEAFSLPLDERIIGVVGNVMGAGDRKGVDIILDAFAHYVKHNKARLVLMVNDDGRLRYIAKTLGITERVWFSSDYIKNFVLGQQIHMGVLYRAFDVLLHTSAAEGFGLCMAEAMATGTPVIAAKTTSMPEVVGQGGILVPATHTRRAPHGGFWHFPDTQDVIAALEEDLSDCQPKKQARRWHYDHTISAWQALFEEADRGF